MTPQSVTQALQTAARRLEGISEHPMRDARLLMAEAIGVPGDRLTLHLNDPVSTEQVSAFDRMVARRQQHEPVSRILGQRLFFGRRFKVTSDVLDPRPETETLILESLKGEFSRVLDLGVGSGCILCTLLAERPAAQGVGADISAGALHVAQTNAAALGVQERAEFIRSNWFETVTGQFDLIISNPPYIAAQEMPSLDDEVRNWDPEIALTDHLDGLEAYRQIAAGAARFLQPKGRLIVEFGATQAPAVADILGHAGYSVASLIKDLDGRDRAISAVIQ